MLDWEKKMLSTNNTTVRPAAAPAKNRLTTERIEVPLADLRAQYSRLGTAVMESIREVVEIASFILGPKTLEFEKAFAEYCGVKHAIGVNSGTSALHLALIAAGVEAGDEVITTPMTFIATSWAI